jgi:hypothetical protein
MLPIHYLGQVSKAGRRIALPYPSTEGEGGPIFLTHGDYYLSQHASGKKDGGGEGMGVEDGSLYKKNQSEERSS